MAGRVGSWVIAGAVVAASVYAFLAGSGDPSPVGRGTPAPPFELPSLDVGTVSMEGLRGRVVLLNFWATWCGPCEEEMPAMERLYQALQGDDFELLAISVDDTAEPVDRFQDRMQLSFPILLDTEQQISALYQTFRFPESLLVDREGRIVERFVGPKEWDAPAYVERIRRLVELPSGNSS